MQPGFFIKTCHTGFQYQIVRVPFGMQILYQIIAGYAGKTKAELFHRLFVKLPLQQIAVSPFAPPAAQLVIKISGRFFIDFQQFCLLAFFLLHFVGILYFRQVYPCPIRQQLHCLRKGIILVFHNKSKNIASCPASEAIIHLLAAGNGKGRGFFIMERTKPKMVCPLFLQTDITGNHIHDIIFHPYFFH